MAVRLSVPLLALSLLAVPTLPALTATATAAAAAAAPAAAAPAPVARDELYLRPADGRYLLDGRGWGHGRGMSQWGAQGAASLGRSADTITGTYYPGTAKAALPDAPVRVLLSGDEGRDTEVLPAPGLSVADLATGAALRLPAGPSRWRVTADAAGLHLSSLTGTTWTPHAVAGRTTFAGPLRFAGPPLVRVRFPDGSARDYRRSVRSVQTSASTLGTVAVMGLEDYLLGVVPREAPASWLPAALQAQSIAARSYSAWKRARPRTSWYDICDTTACQVFGGTRHVSRTGVVTGLEPASTTAAVLATRGVVRTWNGQPIFAEFSSSNGGWSSAGSVPYLPARPDPWDGVLPHRVHRWTASLPATDLERAFPAVGRLTGLRVLSRDGVGHAGGRVGAVVLEGRSSTGALTRVSTTGAALRTSRAWPAAADGLRSTFFAVRASLASRTVARSAAPTLALPPGTSQGSVVVRLRNTGSATWPVAGLRLAAIGPDGLRAAGGRNATRPGADVVHAGEDVELRLRVDAAALGSGRHARTYRLRIGTGPLFGALVPWTVTVR